MLGGMLIGGSACGMFGSWAFYSWVLVPGVLVPRLRVLGIMLTRSAKRGVAITSTRSLGSPRQSRHSSAAARPPTASPGACSRVVARCFKGVSWEGLCAREGRFEDILLSEQDGRA